MQPISQLLAGNQFNGEYGQLFGQRSAIANNELARRSQRYDEYGQDFSQRYNAYGQDFAQRQAIANNELARRSQRYGEYGQSLLGLQRPQFPQFPGTPSSQALPDNRPDKSANRWNLASIFLGGFFS